MEQEIDPDIDWVAALAAAPSEAAQRAVSEAAGEKRLFDHLVRQHRSGGRSGYVEIDAPLELYALARLLRPRHVVEVGVSSGVSSAYLLRALERNGRGTLHSIDLPQRERRRPNGGRSAYPSWSLPPGREPGWAIPSRLHDGWDLRLGDKADLLPLLAEELPCVDLFVYDVPHRDVSTAVEFQRLDPRLMSGAVAIADHGPGGELCTALRGWARRRHATPVGRRGLGLYGFRCPSGSGEAPAAGTRGRPRRTRRGARATTRRLRRRP